MPCRSRQTFHTHFQYFCRAVISLSQSVESDESSLHRAEADRLRLSHTARQCSVRGLVTLARLPCHSWLGAGHCAMSGEAAWLGSGAVRLQVAGLRWSQIPKDDQRVMMLYFRTNSISSALKQTLKMTFAVDSPSSSASLSTPSAPRASQSSAPLSFGQAYARLLGSD